MTLKVSPNWYLFALCFRSDFFLAFRCFWDRPDVENQHFRCRVVSIFISCSSCQKNGSRGLPGVTFSLILDAALALFWKPWENSWLHSIITFNIAAPIDFFDDFNEIYVFVSKPLSLVGWFSKTSIPLQRETNRTSFFSKGRRQRGRTPGALVKHYFLRKT